MSVLLSLVPLKGGTGGGRYFPHSGYPGITPVSLHGTVRTRLALDGDRKPLLAQKVHVAVRCYESRLGRLGVLQTNVLVDIQTTLWEHPTMAPLADLDLPFRIVIPSDVVAQSTNHMHDYRVFWRIEAVITHAPHPSFGSRQLKAYDIALYRHDPRPQHLLLNPTTSSGRVSQLDYSLTTPSYPIGPGDSLPIRLSLRPSLSDVMRISISVDRRTEFHSKQQQQHQPSSSSEALPLLTPPPTASSVDSSSESKSKSKRSSDPSQFAFSHPSSPSPASKATSVALTSLVLEKSDIAVTNVQSEKDGVWCTEYAPSATAPSLALPVTKAGHWALGETLSTPLATICFFISVKVYLSNAPQEPILLPPQELFVSSLNEAKVSQAMAKVSAVSSYRRVTSSTRSDLVERTIRRKHHPSTTSSSPYPSSSSGSPSTSSPSAATSTSTITPTRRSPVIALTPPSTDTLPSPPPSPVISNADSTTALIVRQPGSLRRTRGRHQLSVAQPLPVDSQSDDEDEEDFGMILGGDLTFSRPLSTSGRKKRAGDEDKSAKEDKQKKRSKRSTGVGMAGLRTVVAAVKSGVAGGTSSTVSAGIAALASTSRSIANPSDGVVELPDSSLGYGPPPALSTPPARRPNTSSGLFSAPPSSRRTQPVPRAGSVGATSPTLVVAMSTMMDDSLGRGRHGGSMDVCTSEEDDASPFSFSPPPATSAFEIASPAPVLPATMHAHAQASSLSRGVRSPEAHLLEWEAELDRIASQSRLKTKNMRLRV